MTENRLPFLIERFTTTPDGTFAHNTEWSPETMAVHDQLMSELESMSDSSDPHLRRKDIEIYFAIKKDGTILGRISFIVENNAGFPYGVIFDALVRLPYRGQGIGTALVQYVMEHAETSIPPIPPLGKGRVLMSWVQATVPKDALAAQKLFEKCQFQYVRTIGSSQIYRIEFTPRFEEKEHA